MYCYCLRILLLISLWIVTVLGARAQNIDRINSSEFLSQTFVIAERSPVIENQSIRFPWIEQYDIRTETRDLDFEKQEYTLRLDPSSRKKRNAYKALYQMYTANPDLRAYDFQNEKIYSAYRSWVTLYFIEKRNLISEELQILYADKALLSERKLNASEISFKELIDVELSNTDLEIKSFDDALLTDFFLVKYAMENKLLDFTDMISIEEVLLTVESMVAAESGSELEKYNYDQEIINREIAIEKAEGKHYFDFLQFKYQGPHDDLLAERFSIGMGAEIPNTGTRKLKIEELKLKQLELERDYENDKQEVNIAMSETKAEIILEIKSLMFKKEVRIQQAKRLEVIGQKVQTQEGYDPEILLDIKEKKLKSSLNLLDLEESIYEDYIKLLAESLQLFKQPFQNHLISSF